MRAVHLAGRSDAAPAPWSHSRTQHHRLVAAQSAIAEGAGIDPENFWILGACVGRPRRLSRERPVARGLERSGRSRRKFVWHLASCSATVSQAAIGNGQLLRFWLKENRFDEWTGASLSLLLRGGRR